MKRMNFFSIFFLVLGSLVLNLADAFAQTRSPIRPLPPFEQQDGVEVNVGVAVPGSRDTLWTQMNFSTPTSRFEPDSISLTVDSAFFVRVDSLSPIRDYLSLSVGFIPPKATPYGRDWLDTLKINVLASGYNPFVRPLRGTAVMLDVFPSSILFPEQVAPGDTSIQPQSLIVDALSHVVDSFDIKFNTNAFYAEAVNSEFGVPPSRLFVDVWFTPPNDGPGITAFYDTLTISNRNDSTFYVAKVPVYAHSKNFTADAYRLDFGQVKGGYTDTLDLNVAVSGISIDTILLTEITDFNYELGDNWNPSEGGLIHVLFKPESIQDLKADLIFVDNNSDFHTIRLQGEGIIRSVITADPEDHNFEDVSVGDTATFVFQVTLTDPDTPLTINSFSLLHDTVFSVAIAETVSENPDSEINVAVSFFPKAAGVSYTDSLIVFARYAENHYILLLGDGSTLVPSPSLRRATAISDTEAATAPALSVKDGDIIVSRAPAGSSIQVYNLQGQALKTQTVTSDAEILKTASFPGNVYVVLVNDKNQEILRQKVVLSTGALVRTAKLRSNPG
jgi:hypothetical protein